MGIHINGDHNSVNVVHGDVNNYGGDNGPPSSPPSGFLGIFFVGMILVWLIIKFWWVVLIVASLGAVAFGMWTEQQEKRQAELEAQRREEMLAARAERQNSAYLRGESWGMYGNFPPG
jgi:hypothetical protein